MSMPTLVANSAPDDDGSRSPFEFLLAMVPHSARGEVSNYLRGTIPEVIEKCDAVSGNIVSAIMKEIGEIDQLISTQLNEVMHAEKFQELERTWRGLWYLVDHSETSEKLQIKVLNATKGDLQKDQKDAGSKPEHSQLFKKLHDQEYGTPGGEPYGAVIGDFEFSKSPEDIGLLKSLSSVAAMAFCPLITAAAPDMLGLEKWPDLVAPQSLSPIFMSKEYIPWRSFRESEDSRYVVLTLPRVLARLPYGSRTAPVEEFAYEEAPIVRGELGELGEFTQQMEHEHYCWMNAAYVLGARITDSFARYGWCTAIRGVENGGVVEDLPNHVHKSDDGSLDAKCPTEIGITDHREGELSKLGFLPLLHWKNTDWAAFIGAQTAQKPDGYDTPDASASAQLSARLPYIMAASRFAHYLKVICRNKIGAQWDKDGLQKVLNRWIARYVSTNPGDSPEVRAKYPLRAASVEVVEALDRPGAYDARIQLVPAYQLESINIELNLVARLPPKK